MISLLGENIKKERLKAGLSMEKLSKFAGVGISAISEIESGKRQSLRSETIEKIARALDVNVNKLFGIENVEEGFVVSELDEAINLILEDDEVCIDGIIMTKEEKIEYKKLTKMFVESVKNQRR